MKHFNPLTSSKQTGYTIVETMIAIVIGLVVTAGILEIFLSTRTMYTQQSEFARLQERERFLENYIGRVIRLTGYRSPPVNGLFPTLEGLYTPTNPYAFGISNTGPNNSDTLIIRYQGSGDGGGNPDGFVADCLNNGIDSDVMSTNTLSLSNNNELQCQAVNPSASPSNNTQVLIPGVEAFHVLYGEDLNGDSSADRYVPIDYPFLDTANIVSIRLSFVLRSDNEIRTTPLTSTFNLLGTTYTTPSDRFIRHKVSFTVVLRNVLERPF